jgi:hypothetical protein
MSCISLQQRKVPSGGDPIRRGETPLKLARPTLTAIDLRQDVQSRNKNLADRIFARSACAVVEDVMQTPPHAQNIYREAFNHAFADYAGEARIACAAVKRS